MTTPRITKAHRDDIAKLSERLAEAAERHGLCSEFRDEIEAINEGLLVPLTLSNPTVTGWVTYEVRVDVTNAPAETGNQWHDALDQEFADTLVKVMEKALKSAPLPESVSGVEYVEPTDSYLHAD